jgi:hypothetical protein
MLLSGKKAAAIAIEAVNENAVSCISVGQEVKK